MRFLDEAIRIEIGGAEDRVAYATVNLTWAITSIINYYRHI
jgi:hypothetical protein